MSLLLSQKGVYAYGAPRRSISHSSRRSARTTWSASTKMILSRVSGKSTSRNSSLYAQMMRCFSVCRLSHVGHLYVTSSYSNPYSAATCGRKSLNRGLSQFLMNQNLSGLAVCRRTESIMIFRKRSYRCPDATENTWMVSSCPRAVTSGTSSTRDAESRFASRAPNRDVTVFTVSHHPFPSVSPPEPPPACSSSTSSRSIPGHRASTRRSTRPFQLDTETSAETSSCFSLDIESLKKEPSSSAVSVSVSNAAPPGAFLPSRSEAGAATRYTSRDRPGCRRRSCAPGCVGSWKYPRLLITMVPASPMRSCAPRGGAGAARAPLGARSEQCPVTSSASRRYSARITRSPRGRSSSRMLSRSYAATAVVTSHCSGTSRCAVSVCAAGREANSAEGRSARAAAPFVFVFGEFSSSFAGNANAGAAYR